ncbi:hypothetical protein [Solibacillus cecembensis]|uniref:hypothetical protein n=1 Tax=Solibacillus cecembensis TaxID=459347 RepID=UPI003CFF4362
MRFTKFLLVYSIGYLAAILITYFLFDWYSLTFVVGSLMGIGLFAVILKGLLRRGS